MIDRARLRGLAESVVDGKGRPFSSDAAPFLEACTPSVVLELLNVISVLEQALWPGDASNLLARAEAAEAKLEKARKCSCCGDVDDMRVCGKCSSDLCRDAVSAVEAKLAVVTAKLARAVIMMRAHERADGGNCPECGGEGWRSTPLPRGGNRHEECDVKHEPSCELAAVLGENEPEGET